MSRQTLYLSLEHYLNNIRSIDMDAFIGGLTIMSELDADEYSHIIKDIISRNDRTFFWCGNYKIAKMIEEMLPQNGDYQIGIIDDFKNVDRSYINTADFKKAKLFIPVAYVMWGVNVEKEIGVVHGMYEPNYEGYVIASECETISLETIKEVQRIVSMMGEEKDLNQIEKLLIISNHLQAYVQYTMGIVTKNLNKVYVVPYNESLGLKPRDIDSVVLSNYGLCSSIANTTILLSNNPTLKIDAREAFNWTHSWNAINFGNRTFYIDNSRAITRNKNLFDGTLKSKELNTDFLLFGEETANNYGGYGMVENILLPINLSKTDFDRNYMEAAKESLIEKGLLNPSYPEDSITFHTSIK